jgi:tyrosine-protein kinase Etk/Wzc
MDNKAGDSMERQDVNILDYLFLLYRARWYIGLSFFIVVISAVVVSNQLPVYYRSATILLPPSESDESLGFSQVMRMLPVNIRLGSTGSPSDIYIGVMKSYTVSKAMVDKFDLVNVYGSRNVDQAILSLNSLSEFLITEDGLLMARVQDRDPERAAAIANFYWVMLDSINRDIARESADARARFLDQQIAKNREALNLAEEELRAFQLKTNVVSPLHQERVALSMTSEIEADILLKEGLLQEYRAKSLAEGHPLVRDILQSLRSRYDQLNAIKYGNGQKDTQSVFVPLNEIPEVMVEYNRLSRRVEILDQIEQVMLQQYEEAIIQKENILSTVDVLDHASVPEQKFRPKRSLIVIVAATASLFFSILSVILIEYVNRLTELTPENREKVQRLVSFLHIQR